MRVLVGVCLTASIVSSAAAMAAAQAPSDSSVPTLHAYADLVQLPTLVLSSINFKPVNWVDQRKFSVSFDGGPKFHVTHARIEGDDPLSVAILLDANRANPKVADQAIASLAPLSLHANDSVTIYGMDCQVAQSPEGGPTEAPTLKRNVDLLLAHEDTVTQAGDKAKCQNPANLMDTLGVMVQALSAKPGRRVILAITDGVDRGSQTSWNDLRHFAQAKSVTIFGLMSPPTFTSPEIARMQQPFDAVCQSSGGVVLLASGFDLAKELAWAVTLIRSRYILEFPRPMSTEDGLHAIQVTIAEGDMFIRPAGASFPTLNPLASRDPNTIAPGPANRPQMGKSKPPNPQPGDFRAAVASQTPSVASPGADAPGVSSPAVAKTPITAPASSHASASSDSIVTVKAPAIAPSAPLPGSTLPSGETTLKVSSRLTLVDVTVTDSKGRPVHGLAQADFAVKEDGKPQPIRNFEEFGAEKPLAEAALQKLPQLPPGAPTNQAASQPDTEAVNLLLFDQVATGISGGLQPHPEALKDAKAASLKYLKTMPAGTRVAILELNGSGLHIVQGFTSDQNLLLAAVDSITFRAVPDSYWSGGADASAKSLPLLCNAMNFQSAQALNAMNQTAAFVSNIPGRKNLIWFTPGIPWLFNYPPFNAPAPIGRTSIGELLASLIDHTPQLQQAYGHLTEARVAVYPIDPRGLGNDPGFTAGGTSGPPGGLGDISNFRVASFLDNGSLDDVAKATGGEAYYGNDLDSALQRAETTGAEYYALSYIPPLSKYDGKYHKIEVKVDRPGVQVEYRRGYTSVDLEKAAPSH